MASTRSAPTVVFLPGFIQRAEAWSPVDGRVGERYRSVCLDFRGSSFEERLAEIAAAGPPGAVLVGYSMGGRLALHAAMREPTRFGALVLVAASAGIEDESERRARHETDESLALWMESHPIEEIVARWEAMPVFAGQSPALLAAQRPGRLSHAPAELARLLRSAGQGALPPLWDRLCSLACPLLAVAGARDRPYAEAARRMARLAPRGGARLVPGAGHAPQLEAPDAVARLLLEFLDEHFLD